jgi:hypothetical protein
MQIKNKLRRKWKNYFINATILGIDIDSKCKKFEEDKAILIIEKQQIK